MCWFCSRDYIFILFRRHGHRYRTAEEGVDPRATQLTERILARVERVTFQGDIHDTKSPRSTGSEEKGWSVEKETLICYDTLSFYVLLSMQLFHAHSSGDRGRSKGYPHFVRYVCICLRSIIYFTPATHRPPAMNFLRWWVSE